MPSSKTTAVILMTVGLLIAGTGSVLVKTLHINIVGLIVVIGLVILLTGALVNSKTLDDKP